MAIPVKNKNMKNKDWNVLVNGIKAGRSVILFSGGCIHFFLLYKTWQLEWKNNYYENEFWRRRLERNILSESRTGCVYVSFGEHTFFFSCYIVTFEMKRERIKRRNRKNQMWRKKRETHLRRKKFFSFFHDVNYCFFAVVTIHIENVIHVQLSSWMNEWEKGIMESN